MLRSVHHRGRASRRWYHRPRRRSVGAGGSRGRASMPGRSRSRPYSEERKSTPSAAQGRRPTLRILVALVDGFGVVGAKPRSEGAFAGLMRWLRAGAGDSEGDDGVNAMFKVFCLLFLMTQVDGRRRRRC